MREFVEGSIMSYSAFINWVGHLVKEGKTSGDNPTEELIGFTALNLKRMERIYKTLTLNATLLNTLKKLQHSYDWWVITEAWCGDSAQTLPVIAKMAQESEGKINLFIVMRDQNQNIMKRYLTNGRQAIPKLVALDETENECMVWGPRPQAAQEILLNWKIKKETSKEEFEKELHTWYAQDKSQTLQKEFLQLLQNL